MLNENDIDKHHMHKHAKAGVWALVFECLKKYPEYINDISVEFDGHLAHYAAQQGDLHTLSRLKELGCNFNLCNYSGQTVFDYAVKHDELLTVIKTVAWLKGNTNIEYKDPTLYMDTLKTYHAVGFR